MRTPKDFDYDLWTTEDGKNMVRIKATGEVTEVSHEIMKLLRAEEKKERRQKKRKMGSLHRPISLSQYSDDIDESNWISDPNDYLEDITITIDAKAFLATLSEIHRCVFQMCIIEKRTTRECSKSLGISKSYVSKLISEIREKFEKFFEN